VRDVLLSDERLDESTDCLPGVLKAQVTLTAEPHQSSGLLEPRKNRQRHVLPWALLLAINYALALRWSAIAALWATDHVGLFSWGVIPSL
jgi:hypothetical protein